MTQIYNMLLSICHEYRLLNQTLNDRFSDFWFRLTTLPSRLKYKSKRKITDDEFGI